MMLVWNCVQHENLVGMDFGNMYTFFSFETYECNFAIYILHSSFTFFSLGVEKCLIVLYENILMDCLLDIYL